jgi:hypothetical protein
MERHQHTHDADKPDSRAAHSSIAAANGLTMPAKPLQLKYNTGEKYGAAVTAFERPLDRHENDQADVVEQLLRYRDVCGFYRASRCSR